MNESKLFIRGVPTEPDVQKLRAAIGVPAEGQLVTWATIETVVGCKYGTNRFRSIVDVWRRCMRREHNVVFAAEPGKGLVHLPPNERVEYGVRNRQFGLKKTFRAVTVIATTDRKRLTPENERVADHNDRFAAAMRLTVATQAKELNLPKPK